MSKATITQKHLCDGAADRMHGAMLHAMKAVHAENARPLRRGGLVMAEALPLGETPWRLHCVLTVPVLRSLACLVDALVSLASISTGLLDWINDIFKRDLLALRCAMWTEMCCCL